MFLPKTSALIYSVIVVFIILQFYDIFFIVPKKSKSGGKFVENFEEFKEVAPNKLPQEIEDFVNSSKL